MRPFLALFFLLCGVRTEFSAQTPQDLAVSLHVAVGTNPPGVLVTWPNPEVSDIQLRRRTKGQPGTAWTIALEEAHTFRDGYYDTTALATAETYEYALERKTGPLTAYGYAYAALMAPVVDTRGKILIFIDSLTADQLGADLINFKNDLRGEGWQIMPFKTGPYTTVQGVKNQIVNTYNANPGQVKVVLLIGSVPVPYAGSQARDQKPDHVGAWPCDAYYGDIDGLWTDELVDVTSSARAANRNVPGDGKFDQDILPSAVELAVGRLDFRHLSPALFGMPPVELLRRYLSKNHRWRTGQFAVPNRAVVDDHLGWSNGEAFAAAGFRNAYPLMESSQVVSGDFLSNAGSRYLLGFGAGANGTYTSADGVATAADFATDSANVVFATFFGDYFGDWDYETNPLLPAALAAKGGLLACGWAGRPHWLLQGLAAGETIGYCLKETQNAQYNDAYGHSPSESGTHVALLGDPTLRAQVVQPATQLSVKSNCTRVNLQWTASPDPGVLGYLIYRAFEVNGPYTRLTANAIPGTAWSDLNPVADTLYYSVRALKLEVVPGGGHFYNASTGVIKSVIFLPGALPTILGLGGDLNCQVNFRILGAHFQVGTTVQWFKPNGAPLGGYIATEGGVYTVVATAQNGCTAAAFATVTMDTVLPLLNLPSVVTIDCAHPTEFYTLPADTTNEINYLWNGMAVPPGGTIDLATSGVLRVSSSGNGCSKTYVVTVSADFTPPGAEATSDGNALDCSHAVVQLYGNSGAANAVYAWAGNGGEVSFLQNPIVTLAGEYCLTVTALNGCTSVDCVQVAANPEAVAVQILASTGPCNNGGSIVLSSNVLSGTLPVQYAWSNGETTANVTLPPGFAGTLDLTVTDAQGCVGVSAFSIAPPLTAFVLKNNESVSGAADGSIDLEVAGGLPPYQYQWSNGSTTEDLNGLSGGIYNVTCTDVAGCFVVVSVSITTTVSTEDAVVAEYGLRIFPNPAATVVGIYFQEKTAAMIRLTDLTGRLIATRVGEESVFLLDTSWLDNGLYLLWIQLPTGRTRYRLVVAR